MQQEQLPSFRHLQYLTALRETGHFGKAADKCFVTQSTLSAGISELESQLGLELVERINKRNIQLTPLAHELAEKAGDLLIQGLDWVKYAHQKNKPLDLTLRVGVIPTIAPFLIPDLIASNKRKFPDLQLDIRETTSSSIINHLNLGDLDVGILALPFPTGNLNVEVLLEDRFYVAVPKENPLSKKKKINVAMLKDEKLLLLDEGHCLTDHTLKVCKMNYDRKVAGSSLFTLVQLVQSGYGVTLVPAMGKKALEGFNRKVVFVPLEDQGAYREIALIARSTWQNTLARNAISSQVSSLAKK